MLIPFWTYSLQRKKSNCCLRKADYTFSIDYILQLNLIKKSKYIQRFMFLCMSSCCISNSAMQLKEKGSLCKRLSTLWIPFKGLWLRESSASQCEGGQPTLLFILQYFFSRIIGAIPKCHSIIFLSTATAIPVYILGTNSLPTESGFSWQIMNSFKAQEKMYLLYKKCWTVHLIFLNLRWSSCVALIFSLLTTSSCLLFLLNKYFTQFKNLFLDFALIQIPAFPDLVF